MVSHAEAKCRHNINQSGEGEKEREKGSKEGGGRKGRRRKGFARTLYQELRFSWDLLGEELFSLVVIMMMMMVAINISIC